MEFRNIKSLDELLKYAEKKEAISLLGAAGGAIKGMKGGPQGAAIGAALGGFQIKDVLSVLEGDAGFIMTAIAGPIVAALEVIPETKRIAAASFIREKMTEYNLTEDNTLVDIAEELIAKFASGSDDTEESSA